MKSFHPTRVFRRSGAVAACLAIVFSGCSEPPAPTTSIGLTVTEHTRLREPVEPAYENIDSIVFSADGKELAIARWQAKLLPGRGPSGEPLFDDTTMVETFRVGDFARTGSVTSAGRKEGFHVAAAPQTEEASSNGADPFMAVRGTFFAPKEITVASGKTGKVIRSLRFQPKLTFTHEPMFLANGVAVAPNRPLVAVALGGDHDHDLETPRQGEVVVWDFGTGEEQLHFHSTDYAFSAVAFSADGQFLVAAGSTYLGNRNGREVHRSELRCWAITSGKLAFRIESPTSLGCIAFSPDGLTIAAASTGGTLRFYRTSDGREYDTHQFAPLGPVHRSSQGTDRGEDDSHGVAPSAGSLVISVTALAFSPDGKFLAAGVGSGNRGANWGELRMLDITNKRDATVGFERHGHPVTCVAFSPNGRWLAAASMHGFARVFSVKNSLSASDGAGERPTASDRK